MERVRSAQQVRVRHLAQRADIARARHVPDQYVPLRTRRRALRRVRVSPRADFLSKSVFFVSKEQRGEKSGTLLRRVWEHCMSIGYADVYEFAALLGRGGQQVLYAGASSASTSSSCASTTSSSRSATRCRSGTPRSGSTPRSTESVCYLRMHRRQLLRRPRRRCARLRERGSYEADSVLAQLAPLAAAAAEDLAGGHEQAHPKLDFML
jgi:hypothetical protein